MQKSLEVAGTCLCYLYVIQVPYLVKRAGRRDPAFFALVAGSSRPDGSGRVIVKSRQRLVIKRSKHPLSQEVFLLSFFFFLLVYIYLVVVAISFCPKSIDFFLLTHSPYLSLFLH